MRLSAARRRLAGRHAGLVEAIAWDVRTPLLDADERRSAAGEGLCLAALEWTRADGPFRRYALRRMRWMIYNEIKARRRRPAAPIAGEPADTSDPAEPVEARDEADWFRSRLGLLSPRQRHAVDLLLAGRRYSDVGPALGTTVGQGGRLLRGAVARLRAVAP